MATFFAHAPQILDMPLKVVVLTMHLCLNQWKAMSGGVNERHKLPFHSSRFFSQIVSWLKKEGHFRLRYNEKLGNEFRGQ
jgi:uncharacterized membrane protein YwaF